MAPVPRPALVEVVLDAVSEVESGRQLDQMSVRVPSLDLESAIVSARSLDRVLATVSVAE